MSNKLTSIALMNKAQQACSSAQVLLGLGDSNGACNRAYYAMFDAARAALLTFGVQAGKSHSGLISAFSQHLVKSGLVPVELGRLLKRAEGFRMVADYMDDSVELSDAQEMVAQAASFVTAMRTEFIANFTRRDDSGVEPQ